MLDIDNKAGYDPQQIRDPHTGEWIDSPGGGGLSLDDFASLSADWYSQLTGLERTAVQAYKEGRSSEINGALRDGDVPSRLEGLVHQIDLAIAKGSIPEGGATVYRSGHPDVLSGEDPAFASASLRPGAADMIAAHRTGTGEDTAIAEIHLPAGFSAGFPESGGIYGSEYEVLLPRGTRFRQIGEHERVVEAVPGHRHTIRVIVVEPEE